MQVKWKDLKKKKRNGGGKVFQKFLFWAKKWLESYVKEKQELVKKS